MGSIDHQFLKRQKSKDEISWFRVFLLKVPLCALLQTATIMLTLKQS